jgi:hypothetical protein
MNIRPTIEGFEGQDIEIKASMWTGTRMVINGQKAPKGQRRGEMSLTRNDGRVVNARWIPQMFGFDTSQLGVDGKTYVLTPQLKWYEVVLSALPLVMVFIGGLLGAIIGIVAFSASASIFRSGINKAVKILLSLLVIVVAAIVYIIFAAIVYGALN